jgi:CRP-like cAMP-binding protein
MQQSETQAVGATGGLLAEVFADPDAAARSLTVPAGEVIFEADDYPASLYLIESGQVRLLQPVAAGEQRLLEIMGPGDWFGTAALAGSERTHMRAVAAEPSVILEVGRDAFCRAISRRPDALLELNRGLAGKLQTARDESTSLVFQDCNDRLIQTLVRFSTCAAAAPHPEGVVLRITHQQLAQAVGVARETISLALTQLRRRNLVRTGRNQLVFNPVRLRDLQNQEMHNTPDRRVA